MLDVDPPEHPARNLKEFLVQIATITLGLLIALALEQAAEALHHRSEAREMAAKLRNESIENKQVIAFDLQGCQTIAAQAEGDMAALAQGKIALSPMDALDIYRPSDAAWITMRDSGLLPIVPKLLVDNYWKLEATNDAFQRATIEVLSSQRAVDATLAVTDLPNASPADIQALRLRISQFREDLREFCFMAAALGDANTIALAGERIDIKPRPSSG